MYAKGKEYNYTSLKRIQEQLQILPAKNSYSREQNPVMHHCSLKVHPTLGFRALPGGAGQQDQPCSSKAPQAGSRRILAISPLVSEWIPSSERANIRVWPKSQTQETEVLESALLLTASPQPLGAPYWSEAQRRQEGLTLPISQACKESSERSCGCVKLEKHSLNIKVSLLILETEDIF